jgi:hypothetical protein
VPVLCSIIYAYSSMEVKLWNICPQNWLDKRIIYSTHIGSKLAKTFKSSKNLEKIPLVFSWKPMILWGFWNTWKGLVLWFRFFQKYLEPIFVWKMKELSNIGKYPTYLRSFDINYIVFRNVELFRFLFFFKEKHCERKYWISKIIYLSKWIFQNK